MTKFAGRIVALVLIPALAMDPVFAQNISRMPLSFSSDYFSTLTQQALAAQTITAEREILLGTPDPDAVRKKAGSLIRNSDAFQLAQRNVAIVAGKVAATIDEVYAAADWMASQLENAAGSLVHANPPVIVGMDSPHSELDSARMAQLLVHYLRQLPESIRVTGNSMAGLSPQMLLMADILSLVPTLNTLMSRHLQLQNAEGSKQNWILSVGERSEEHVSITIEPGLVKLNAGQNTVLYPQSLWALYPIVGMLYRVIEARPRQSLETIDFSNLVAGPGYDQVAQSVLNGWDNFSVGQLGARIAASNLYLNRYPDEDAKKPSETIFRVHLALPTPVNFVPEAPRVIDTGGFTLKIQRRDPPQPPYPSLIVLYDLRTKTVERIAVHMPPTFSGYDGQFLEITPSMRGFSQAKSQLENKLQNLADIPGLTQSQVHLVWPQIEGSQADFERAASNLPIIRFIFLQIQKRPISNFNLVLNRGLWSLRDTSRSQTTTGGTAHLLRYRSQIVQMVGKNRRTPIDWAGFFHESIHTLWHRMVVLGEIDATHQAMVLTYVKRHHPHFRQWLMNQVAYQQQAGANGSETNTVIQEWLSHTGTFLFNAFMQQGREISSHEAIVYPWGDPVTVADRGILQQLGFWPTATTSSVPEVSVILSSIIKSSFDLSVIGRATPRFQPDWQSESTAVDLRGILRMGRRMFSSGQHQLVGTSIGFRNSRGSVNTTFWIPSEHSSDVLILLESAKQQSLFIIEADQLRYHLNDVMDALVGVMEHSIGPIQYATHGVTTEYGDPRELSRTLLATRLNFRPRNGISSIAFLTVLATSILGFAHFGHYISQFFQTLAAGSAHTLVLIASAIFIRTISFSGVFSISPRRAA